MKTTKELLQIMYDNSDCITSGLCFLVDRIYTKGLISNEEFFALDSFLQRNKPITFWRIFHPKSKFWWKKGRIEPRRKWLKKQIKKLS
jgi:hypothetical protein